MSKTKKARMTEDKRPALGKFVKARCQTLAEHLQKDCEGIFLVRAHLVHPEKQRYRVNWHNLSNNNIRKSRMLQVTWTPTQKVDKIDDITIY